MAATYSGANYFLLQARIIAEQANVDAAATTFETPIMRWSRAPYKGMKQTTCANKYLKAKIHRHAQDLKKVEHSLRETCPTSKIGVQNHVARQHPIQLIEGDTMPKPATLHFNHKLTLPTIIEEVPEQKPSRIKIHSKNSAAGLPTPSKSPAQKPSGIKLRISSPKSATTENNGISKQFQLRFRLNPEDRLPKAFMDEWKHRLMIKHAAWATLDLMDIDTDTDTDTETDNDIETNNNKSPEEVLKATVMLNNKHYGSTRIFHISYFPKKMTAEEKKKAKDDENAALGPERLRLKEYREKRMAVADTNSDYFKALQHEEKNPTMVPSQLRPILLRVQQLQSKGPALHDRYDEKVSKKAVGAFAKAEKIIEDRSKVANLIRVNKEKEVKEEHVLSSITLHMRLHETHNGTRAMGRIEYGMERRWGNHASSPLGRSA